MCLGGGGLLLLNPLYDLLDFAPIRTDTLFLACFPERSTIPRPPPPLSRNVFFLVKKK